MLDKQKLDWKDASKDAGSKENWKHKFDSEEEYINFLTNEGIIKED